uniref:FecR protein domain-containing protein n=1 Tax=Oscillatoriales cyanobacterium SpSt-418 TaxID=2282169 RepID=A0A7C3PJQ5_9CYAN
MRSRKSPLLGVVMSRKLLFVVTLSCSALLSPLFCIRPGAAEVPLTRAVVESLRNNVLLQLKAKPRRPARKADVMTPGDTLLTRQSAQAQLKFNDGTLARVGQFATFLFEPNTRQFNLRNGTVLFLIPPKRGTTRVITPTAVTGIRGSVVIVRHDEATNRSFIASATNSNVEVTTPDGSQTLVLNAGQGAILRDNKVEAVVRFDVQTFYETGDIVQGLGLDKGDLSSDPDLAAVQEEAREALATVAPLQAGKAIQNPPYIQLTQTPDPDIEVPPTSGTVTALPQAPRNPVPVESVTGSNGKPTTQPSSGDKEPQNPSVATPGSPAGPTQPAQPSGSTGGLVTIPATPVQPGSGAGGPTPTTPTQPSGGTGGLVTIPATPAQPGGGNGNPTIPAVPAQPGNNGNPTIPATPAQPGGGNGNPTIPAVPAQPGNNGNPTIPATPAQPGGGNGNPTIPAVPAQPGNNGNPTIPATPAQPGGGNSGVNPAVPTQPAPVPTPVPQPQPQVPPEVNPVPAPNPVPTPPAPAPAPAPPGPAPAPIPGGPSNPGGPGSQPPINDGNVPISTPNPVPVVPVTPTVPVTPVPEVPVVTPTPPVEVPSTPAPVPTPPVETPVVPTPTPVVDPNLSPKPAIEPIPTPAPLPTGPNNTVPSTEVPAGGAATSTQSF